MAINIKFDLVGNPEPPTIILANRNGNKLGQLKVNEKSISLIDKFNDASELSFTMNKYINDKVVPLWEKVVNFKLVYCKEWDTWFEIKVELDDEAETVKTVFCTQLGKAELSQIKLYNVEINTENDIARDDYESASVLYNEKEPKNSILNRMLEKAPHYSIAYVDPTIRNIQRSFSFDDISIDDGFQEIGEEIGCLFKYPSNSGENGKIQRNIFVYDLQQNCNDCGYRGEFIDECPKCGSKNIKYGYGDDTLIFVTADELASDGIQFVTDTDSVKNCFKLEAGDDLMTATIRNCNPNGTDYIWYFSDSIKEDMSDELVEKLQSYDELHEEYYNKEIDLNEDSLIEYNKIIEKYKDYYNANSSICFDCDYKGDFDGVCPSCNSSNIMVGNRLQEVSTPIKGYSNLMSAYYNTIDLSLYLESGLMPSVEMTDTSAEEQAKLLTTSSLSPVAVADITVLSLSTANNAVLSMAKTIVKSTYKVDTKENTCEMHDEGNKRIWSGVFTIVNYSDETDKAESDVISVEINDDLESFIKQKIEKQLNKENTDDLSISGLFEKEYNDFCEELKKYALNPLNRFYDACQTCISVLIDQGIGNNTTWSNNEDGSDGNLYEKLYVPYYNKLKAIEAEMEIREKEIGIVKDLQKNIDECKVQIQNALDFENHLGSDLWLEFCAYRREDKYSNENYISDGLNNALLFKRALEFFEVAENEIYKSSELQHSISTTLNNLLAIPKFKDLVKSFNVGNWIRTQVDDKIYKLRLLEYEINYDDFNNIPVEFSDVTKIKSGITDVESILSEASSMSSSYSTVKRQASQGEKSNATLNNWVENGLETTQAEIVDTFDKELLFGKNGFWCREFDPITGDYKDEQIKIIKSTIAITDNNWETTKTAIGKYYYIDPHTGERKNAYGVNAETIVGKLLIGEQLDITNDNGNLEFGTDGLVVTNGVNTVVINPNNESIFNISKKSDNTSSNVFSLNDDGELVIVGNITASNLTLLDGTTIETENITGLSDVAISGKYNDLIDVPSLSNVAESGDYKDLSNKPTKLSEFENDGVFITNDVNNLTNYYKKTETYKKTEVDNLLDSKANVENLDSKVNADDLADIATSGSYNDLVDIEEFKEWILEQIKSAVNQQADGA